MVKLGAGRVERCEEWVGGGGEEVVVGVDDCAEAGDGESANAEGAGSGGSVFVLDSPAFVDDADTGGDAAVAGGLGELAAFGEGEDPSGTGDEDVGDVGADAGGGEPGVLVVSR